MTNSLPAASTYLVWRQAKGDGVSQGRQTKKRRRLRL